jgi:phosphoglycerol transferase MdoB-like AlkP superfamily enzyme
MKKRILFLIAVFAGWLPVLAVQKPVFMLYHRNLAAGCTPADWLNVVRHGLRLDSTVAGYLTAIPLLTVMLSVWLPGPWVRKTMKIYFALVALTVALIFAGDVALYTFWGFRLDATVLFYMQFPSGAAGSVPPGILIRQILLVTIYALAATWLFHRWIVPLMPVAPVRKRCRSTAVLLLAAGLLFLPIRGSVTASTANVGMVYFSHRQFLNHAAVNPAFSLIASLFKQQDFAAQFQFFPEEKRSELVHHLLPPPSDSAAPPTEHDTLLNTPRPHILLIILESFSANTIEALGGRPGVTPALNRLAGESVLFTNVYAGSFRTDRGLVCALNGYPSQPTTSIMKYPAKSQTLPSLSKSLVAEGYTARMLYGGDINYTNMRSYFYSSGYRELIADTDFPLSERLNKWGANDDVTFERLYRILTEETDTAARHLTTFLTLSSHEPFEVPYHHLRHPYLNSVAFTDSCIGSFVDRIRETPLWKDLLIIFVSDHGFRYPEHLEEYEPARYHIPLLWTGGAVKQPRRIETLASQVDLVATLLEQMNIPHHEFTFSKNVLDPRYPPFTFYTFSNGFGFVDSTGVSVYDNDGRRAFYHSPDSGGALRIEYGKALLQTLYRDMGRR